MSPASLTRDLEAHETKTSNQVAVLILPSLEGEPLESFSHRVGTTWKLGQKGTENGVLLLIALRERKVRIEVGYGLEGTLTDLRSAHIIRQEIVPRFRSGDLPGGIAAGVQAILGTIEGTYKAEEVLSGPRSFRPGADRLSVCDHGDRRRDLGRHRVEPWTSTNPCAAREPARIPCRAVRECGVGSRGSRGDSLLAVAHPAGESEARVEGGERVS